MSKKIERIIMSIPSGDQSTNGRIRLNTNKSGMFYVGGIAKGDTSKILSVGITDQGTPVIDPIDIGWLKSDGRTLEESTIPLKLWGGRDLDISVTSNGKTLSADTDIELIFINADDEYA